MNRRIFLIAICLLVAACRPPRARVAPAVVDGAKQTITATVVAIERGERPVIDGQSLASSVVLSEFYRRRDFRPAWADAAAIEDLLRAVHDSAEDGLEPADYHLGTIERLLATGAATAEVRARLDLVATDAAVRLAYHLRFGKLGPVPVDGAWGRDAAPDGSELAVVLQGGLDDGRVYETFDGLKPRYPLYTRLKGALAEHRRIAAAGGWGDVGAGGALKPGVRDARVPLLRRRLGATGDLLEPAASDPSWHYDAVVAAGVHAFQERHGLTGDGAVGETTLRALDVPVDVRIGQIRATLERCRWVMQDLASRFVLVNVAGYTLAVVDGEVPIWETRVVVGDRFTQTPSFRADLRSIVLNPTWTVPPGIMKNEIVPAMQRDPGYMKRKGYTWVHGQVVQPAGPRNPLGRIKLLMPNRHHIYLHDTPSKAFFSRTTRTFSHGCIRVEHPFALATLALDDPRWTADTLVAAAASGKTRTIVLPRPLPVLVLYATAAVDPDGRTRFLPDVYGRDPEVVAALVAPVGARALAEADGAIGAQP